MTDAPKAHSDLDRSLKNIQKLLILAALILIFLISILLPLAALAQGPSCVRDGETPSEACTRTFVLNALALEQPKVFRTWANDWLDGKDRSADSANTSLAETRARVEDFSQKAQTASQNKEELRKVFIVQQDTFKRLATIAEDAEALAGKRRTNRNLDRYISTHNNAIRAYEKLKKISAEFVAADIVVKNYLQAFVAANEAMGASAAASLFASTATEI